MTVAGPELLPGERLRTLTPSPDLPTFTDEQINEKYVRGEVRIVTEQARYPLSTVPDLVHSDNYFLQPTYQRRHRWNQERRSRLIESFVMNVPIPPIFLYEYAYSKYEVMDGLQRLSTIADFYSNRFELAGLTQWPELNGRYYNTLPESIRAGVDRRYLSSIILLQETAKSEPEAAHLKQLVFERINSGGERLTPQESRNAIYPGRMNDLCIRLSRSESLCVTWGIPTPSTGELLTGEPDQAVLDNTSYREMADVELVLRFFAFRQDPKLLRVALREYFDEYQKAANLFPAETLEGLGRTFVDTIDLAYQTFGERAFWLWRKRNSKWNWLARPTTVAYDTIMWVLCRHLDRRSEILSAAEGLQVGIREFYEDRAEDFEARLTNPSNIVKRRNLFEEFLLSSI